MSHAHFLCPAFSLAGTFRWPVLAVSPYVTRVILSNAQVQVGGKGTVRRKHKAAHKSTGADDKKLQQTLKRLNVTALPVIEEVCAIIKIFNRV